MIKITRRLARQVRTVVRRCLMVEAVPGTKWPLLHVRAGPAGLHLQTTMNDITVLYHDPQPRPPNQLSFRASALADFEGTGDEPVTLELVDQKVRARWNDGGVPRSAALTEPQWEATPPELPKRFTPLPENFLTALAEAARTTPRSAVKLALTRIQLRGRDGALVTTDGRQLLIQQDFPLPWSDEVLVPRLPYCNGPELVAHNKAVAVGRTKQEVALRVGPWTFLLRIDAHARFPKVEDVVPKPASIASRLLVDEEDAVMLVKAVPKLGKVRDASQAITLDVATPPVLRASSDVDDVIEIPLKRSTIVGRNLRFCMDRRLLYRALQLGFREVQIVNGDTPIVCRDAQRIYLWMPLGENGALPPQGGKAQEAKPSNPTTPDERNETMPTPDQNGRSEPAKNGHAHDVPPNGDRTSERPTFEELINESIALRNLLSEATQRAARLATALKHYRRQSRVVRTAIDSLRELRLGP